MLIAKISPPLEPARTLQRSEELIKQTKKCGSKLILPLLTVPLGKTPSCSSVKWNLNFKNE